MRKTLLFAALSAGTALAQDNTPVTPQQFLNTEGIKQTYAVENGQLSPENALQLMLQCTPPITAPQEIRR